MTHVTRDTRDTHHLELYVALLHVPGGLGGGAAGVEPRIPGLHPSD